jgi:potassium channel LctB
MKQSSIFDRLTIIQVVGIWLLGVLVFGLIYFALTFTNQHLLYNNEPLTADANGFANSIYFSAITALTIGYNDLVPIGYSKLAVIMEAIFSIAMLGILIAKIVAVKQEELIQEVEELSFEESTNSAISELYIFRNDAKNIIEQLSATRKVGSQLKDLDQSLSTLTLALTNIDAATGKLSNEQKHGNSLRIELILNSVNFSLSRMIEMLEAFNHRKANWKKESTTATIKQCEQITQKLYEEYSFLKSEHNAANVAEKLDDLDKTLKTLREL